MNIYFVLGIFFLGAGIGALLTFIVHSGLTRQLKAEIQEIQRKFTELNEYSYPENFKTQDMRR